MNEVDQPITGIILRARLKKYETKHEQAMNDIADWYCKNTPKKKKWLMRLAINTVPITLTLVAVTAFILGCTAARL